MSCDRPNGERESVVAEENAGSSALSAGNDAAIAARELEPVEDVGSAGGMQISPRIRRPILSPRYRPHAVINDH